MSLCCYEGDDQEEKDEDDDEDDYDNWPSVSLCLKMFQRMFFLLFVF